MPAGRATAVLLLLLPLLPGLAAARRQGRGTRHGRQRSAFERAAAGRGGAAWRGLRGRAVPGRPQVQEVCVPQRSSMPASWRPSAALEARLSAEEYRPGHANLTLAAAAAARAAYAELFDFIHRPGMVQELGTDALEPIINGAFAGGNMPGIRREGLLYGRDVLLQLARPYLDAAAGAGCGALSEGDLAILVQYGRYIQRELPGNATMDAAQARLEALAQGALRDCGSLEGFLGFSPEERLRSYPSSVEEAANMTQIDRVYGMVLQGVDTVGLLANPNLSLPSGTLDYVVAFWRYLAGYPFPAATEYPGGSRDAGFEQNSYVVTHAAYLPTGYQRYRLLPGDAPWLFSYLRENFYAAMELGSLDLLAEFVDVFRQYNCTVENDAQTRDGTRFMLELYEKAGRNWMAVREADEEAEPSDYNLMHKAWTAYVGLHSRELEEPAPGTYGAVAAEIMALAAHGTGVAAATPATAALRGR